MKAEEQVKDSGVNFQVISDYLLSIKASYAKTTYDEYKRFLYYFFSVMNKPICDISKDDIFRWLADYKINKKPRTIHHRISILTSFLKYCFERKIISNIPIVKRMKPTRVPKGEIKIISLTEKASLDKKVEFLNDRDRLMYEFTSETALRRHEIVKLKKADIDLKKRFALICGKGKFIRTVHFSKKLALQLEKYMETLKGQYLFLNRYGNPISSKHFWRLCKTLQKLANLEVKFYPHMIRHTRLTEIVRETDSIFKAQSEAGHKVLNTTLQYLHPTIEDIRPFYDKGCPK